jgi:FkbM family methyltransferase
VVADIGANEGEWTLSLLDAIPAERRQRARITLHVFEPIPSTLTRLRSSLAGHEFGHLAHVQQLAMSDKIVDARIAILSETGGINTFHPDETADRLLKEWIEVRTTTLDMFCELQDIAGIHLVKSDTEGHDLSVLRGARGLLVAGRIDAFQFEYNHRWIFSRSFLRDVFEIVAGLPYVVARIMPAHIEVLPRWHPELERFFEANYLVVRKPALDWFDVRYGTFDVSNTYA